MTTIEKANIDWVNLGFGYYKTDKRFVSNFKNGAWDEGALVDDENIVISTNQGEPLVGSDTPAGMAYSNVVSRIEGKEVPFLNFEKSVSFFARVTGIFHKA